MRFKFILLASFLAISSISFAQSIILPLGGNTYITHSHGAKITDRGIENWTDPNEIITAYLRITQPGSLVISVHKINNLRGKAVIEWGIDGKITRMRYDGAKKSANAVGTWDIKDTGYVALTIKGISRSENHFPSIESLSIEGTAINERTSYVKSNEGNYFYWGRRGPSVHLNYQTQEQTEAEWFYNEITVPKGNDVIGSYFMANGFAEGYFGIQVNSATERRVLFSVWSPFKTDNPKEIPQSHKIIMVSKGENVYTGEFGDEGSGGQGILKYNWKAESTYKFLLHALPSGDGYTTYTAYFFAPELNQWQLIASFKRPQTQTYLKRLHSFLENFVPETGDQTRTVIFKNQWIYDTKGNWSEVTTARFTTDNTGTINYRKDYAGGLAENNFYLKNCGFFNNFIPPKTVFIRKPGNKKPEIDFSKLP